MFDARIVGGWECLLGTGHFLGIYGNSEVQVKTSVSLQFMRFVKKISDGDVTIKDNEVIEKSVDEKSEEWANEFTGSSQQMAQVFIALPCM